MSVRGIHTDVTDMREKIFTEVARLAYEGGDYSRLEELPYKIVPGVGQLSRKCIYRESHCRRASSTCDWTAKPYTR